MPVGATKAYRNIPNQFALYDKRDDFVTNGSP